MHDHVWFDMFLGVIVIMFAIGAFRSPGYWSDYKDYKKLDERVKKLEEEKESK